MSSSFTNQPAPHDPRREEGYTPTPPPERAGEEDDVESVRPKSKLGSLAQKARGQKLKEARGILLTIGILTLLWNGGFLFAIPHIVDEAIDAEVANQGGRAHVDAEAVEHARSELLFTNYALTGLFFAMGVSFVIFGALVHRFPLAMTISSLVLYVLATLAMIAMAVLDDEPGFTVGSSIVRVFFIVALAKSIKSAYAYEKERRAEQEYGLDG